MPGHHCAGINPILLSSVKRCDEITTSTAMNCEEELHNRECPTNSESQTCSGKLAPLSVDPQAPQCSMKTIKQCAGVTLGFQTKACLSEDNQGVEGAGWEGEMRELVSYCRPALRSSLVLGS